MDQLGFHLSFINGCISGCRSPNEMGVKSTVFRNNHSLMYLVITSKLMVWICYDLFDECIKKMYSPCNQWDCVAQAIMYKWDPIEDGSVVELALGTFHIRVILHTDLSYHPIN